MTEQIVNLPWALSILLSFAVLLACVRLIRWQQRAPVTSRSRPWRLASLLIAQPIAALLLYFTLLPPTLPTEAGTIIVATAGVATAPSQAGDRIIALPEAPALGDAERVPDLATALRRYPGTRQLHIIGAGLEARDREAARGRSVRFDPPPLPRGVVRLDVPEGVAIGGSFRVGGKFDGVTQGSVELLDPAGRRIDSSILAQGGEFVVSGTARVSGPAMFLLQVRDAQRAIVETVEVPLWTRDETPPRLLLLAGAPNPEWKYLRRWATDAGPSLHTQIGVGGGLQLGDAPLALNAADFARFDLVVVDERAWASLGDRQRAALSEAVRAGLGMLLRIDGPLPDTTRRQLRALGLAVSGGGDAAPVSLTKDSDNKTRLSPQGTDAPGGTAEAENDAPAPTLSRRTLRVASTDAVPLLRDAAGSTLAYWRAEGRGRVAVLLLADTFRLVLAGHEDRLQVPPQPRPDPPREPAYVRHRGARVEPVDAHVPAVHALIGDGCAQKADGGADAGVSIGGLVLVVLFARIRDSVDHHIGQLVAHVKKTTPGKLQVEPALPLQFLHKSRDRYLAKWRLLPFLV